MKKSELKEYSKNLVLKIVKELKKNSSLEYKKNSENFFKEKINLYGVRVPITRKISKKYFEEIKKLTLEETFYICEELLQTNYFEMKIIAFDWGFKRKKEFTELNFKVFENWLEKYVKDWASCDDLSNHIFGYFIEKFPGLIPKIKKWANSKNLWVRRSCAVSFIVPARKGNNLKEVIEISKKLMKDKEDLVQKGYGWLLKEASKKNQKEVFNFVIENKNKMPRTALRYSIEKMPKELRKKAMEK